MQKLNQLERFTIKRLRLRVRTHIDLRSTDPKAEPRKQDRCVTS